MISEQETTYKDDPRLKYLEAIETIIQSPTIERYLVGITKDFQKRRRDYWKSGFDSLVILEQKLDSIKALALEEWLFKACTEDKMSALYSRYHPEKRDSSYKKSLGGSKEEVEYVLYLAWRTDKK